MRPIHLLPLLAAGVAWGAAPAVPQDTPQASTAPAPQVSTAPAPLAFPLTLLPPAEASDRASSATTAPTEQAPHSSSSIDLSLEEVHAQREGMFPYGPVSLVYPYWNRAAQTLRDKLGLDIGTETDLVFQAASRGPGIRDAGGGYSAIFGKWRLLGTPDGGNNGYLKFKADYQWQMGDQAPRALGGQVDSLWRTAKGFTENAPSLVQLYWEQHFCNKAFILVVGKLDASSFYATNLWADDKQFFMNAAFSALPAVGLPGNGLGLNAKYNPTSWLYLTAGSQNQAGNKTAAGFHTLCDDRAFFSAMEVGLTPQIPGLGRGNYRLTAWHADAVPGNTRPSDAGLVLSCDQAVTDQVIPFARYEYDQGHLTGLRQLWTGGVGFHRALISKQDLCGLAVAWGQPANDTLRNQYTAETFYRIQLSQGNQLSVGYQVIINPALAPHDETVGVAWLRFRILF